MAVVLSKDVHDLAVPVIWYVIGRLQPVGDFGGLPPPPRQTPQKDHGKHHSTNDLYYSRQT